MHSFITLAEKRPKWLSGLYQVKNIREKLVINCKTICCNLPLIEDSDLRNTGLTDEDQQLEITWAKPPNAINNCQRRKKRYPESGESGRDWRNAAGEWRNGGADWLNSGGDWRNTGSEWRNSSGDNAEVKLNPFSPIYGHIFSPVVSPLPLRFPVTGFDYSNFYVIN